MSFGCNLKSNPHTPTRAHNWKKSIHSANMSAHPHRVFFCAEHDLPTLCEERKVTHVVSIGWPPPEDPTQVRKRNGNAKESALFRRSANATRNATDARFDAMRRAQGRVSADKTLVIAIPDEELADLLAVVPEVTTFIDSALTSDSSAVVAAHCHAGESRSAAVVAAYLMRFENLSVDDALASVGGRGGYPNDGFEAQLRMWEDMGRRVSTAHEAYKLWSVAKLTRERDERGYLESTSVMRDPGAPGAVDDPEGGGWVSCRKCRRRVARGAHVLRHDSGVGMDAFSWKARKKDAASSAPRSARCSSMFVTPLSWMSGIEDGDGGATAGKLLCPGCETKIGAFDWSGIQCSCGAWISPAFQIQRAKTDAFGIDN